jgi:hypothetical protein
MTRRVTGLTFFLVAVALAQWGPDVRLTNNTANSYTSANTGWSIAATGDTVHAVWYDFRDGNYETYYKRSTDGGSTWGTDTRLTASANNSWSPSVAAAGDTVHAVWYDDRDGNWEIYYKRSTDGGASWGSDTRLSSDVSASTSPSVAVAGATVHVVWNDDRDGNFELYYKRSTDGGASWDSDARLTNDPDTSFHPNVAVRGAGVHVVWWDDRDGNFEIYYKRSTNGGASWSADARLTDDPGLSREASVAVNGALVHVVWADDRDGSPRIYYKRSTDGGSTWGGDAPLKADSSGSYYPSVAVAGAIVHVVWFDWRDGNPEIYHKRSFDSGTSWGSDTRLTNDTCSSENASVATADDAVHVVWQDRRDGNYEIYYKRDTTGNVIHDVGCTRIEAPSGFVDSGAVIAPACSVHNYGTRTENYTVRMRIGTGYLNTAVVTGHAPGTSVRVTFLDWTANQVGSVPVTCSTELASDVNSANDRQTGSVLVTADTIWVPEPQPPQGSMNKTVADGGAMASLPGNGDTTYTYLIKGNNTCEFYVYTDPGYGSKSGSGYWTTLESIPRIGRSSKKKAVKKGSALLAADNKIYALKGNSTNEFWCYTPSVKGPAGIVRASGWQQFDDVPGDNKCKDGTSAVSVVIDGNSYVYLLKGGTNEFYRKNLSAKGAWETQTGAPLPPSGKVYKTGSAIVYYPDEKDQDAPTGRIFVLKGSYNEFNAFDLATSTWTPKASLPLTTPPSTKKTKAKAGAGLAYSPSPKLILALKGNKTQEYWKYDAVSNLWTRGKDVPLPPSNKKVGAGGSITCISGIVYITKGNKTTDFYSLPVSESYGDLLTTSTGSQKTTQGSSDRGLRTAEWGLRIEPNPSPLPAIRYSLAWPGRVSLKLYDITGKLITTLASGYHAAGAYSRQLTANSSQLAAGVYLLKYEAGEYRATEKLIIE